MEKLKYVAPSVETVEMESAAAMLGNGKCYRHAASIGKIQLGRHPLRREGFFPDGTV